MRYCPACLSILPEGADVCPACGFPVSDSAPAQQENTSVSFYSGYDEIPFLDTNAVQVANTTPPAVVGSPTTGDIQPMASVSSREQLQLPAAPQRHSRWRTIGRIVLICLLALFLLVESASFALYALVIRPIDFENQATSVANRYLATQGQQLANVWRSLSPLQVYARATSGTPVIDDPLSGPEGNVWYNYGSGKDGCSYEQGAYHIHTSSGGFTCIGYSTFFRDLVFQIDVTMLHADYAGIGVRYSSAGGYVFLIGTNDIYQFNAFDQNNNVKGIKQNYYSTINTNVEQTHQLTAIAVGNVFYLYIDQKPVALAQDNAYNAGQLALFGQNSSGSLDVAFSNVKVWKLP